jgi:sporulation protein YlmC with PRC-barrel domain
LNRALYLFHHALSIRAYTASNRFLLLEERTQIPWSDVAAAKDIVLLKHVKIGEKVAEGGG